MPRFYKLDYRLLNPLGEEVDSSAGGNPMAFVEGDGTMVPGLEAAVLGKLAGDEFEVKIGPEKAYGFSQRSLVRTVAPDMFMADIDSIEVGMIFQVGSGAEAEVARVVAVEDGGITIDANHPLAGVSFHFEISVLESREASGEELEVRNMGECEQASARSHPLQSQFRLIKCEYFGRPTDAALGGVIARLRQ